MSGVSAPGGQGGGALGFGRCPRPTLPPASPQYPARGAGAGAGPARAVRLALKAGSGPRCEEPAMSLCAPLQRGERAASAHSQISWKWLGWGSCFAAREATRGVTVQGSVPGCWGRVLGARLACPSDTSPTDLPVRGATACFQPLGCFRAALVWWISRGPVAWAPFGCSRAVPQDLLGWMRAQDSKGLWYLMATVDWVPSAQHHGLHAGKCSRHARSSQ